MATITPHTLIPAPSAQTGRSQETQQQTAHEDTGVYWGEDGFGFGDLVDILNPLQHVPVLSSVYRSLTGDDLSQGARIMGGTLFGGPLGLVGSVVNAIAEETSGEDVGGHMLAALQKRNSTATNPSALQVAEPLLEPVAEDTAAEETVALSDPQPLAMLEQQIGAYQRAQVMRPLVDLALVGEEG